MGSPGIKGLLIDFGFFAFTDRFLQVGGNILPSILQVRQHRSRRQKNRRQVQMRRRHQHAGDDLVA